MQKAGYDVGSMGGKDDGDDNKQGGRPLPDMDVWW
jgi:hypothetical protein